MTPIAGADIDTWAEAIEGLFPFDEIRGLMLGCMSGSGNEAIGSDELSIWLDDQMDAAEAAYNTGGGHDFFQVENMIDAANVLVWFASNNGGTYVSLSVDPRAELDSS